MRKLLLTVISLLVVGILSFGQTNYTKSYIEIGSGNIESSNPLYTAWKYSWSNFLYSADNLGEAKTITKLSFYASKDFGGYEVSHATQKLYIKHTDELTAGNSYANPDNEGYTLVWEGIIDYPANGPQWMEIDITDFEYDGTSNLALHWQNHSGNSSYISFYCTKVEGAAVNSGSDTSFPADGTGYNSYQNALPNMRIYFSSEGPDTPEAIEPLNNSIKVDAAVEFKFSLSNTTSYDFYLGTDESSLIKVASDVVVESDGNYTYKVEGLLESKTDYFWKVVAKDGGNETASPVFKFKTQLVIDNLPFECGFEDYWVTFLNDTLSTIINTNYPDSSDWTYDDNWNAMMGVNSYQGLFAAKVSAFSAGDYSLMTPRMIIPENSQISFYWRNNYFSEDKSKNFVTTYFEITTDGGATWGELDAITPSSEMPDYEYKSYNLDSYTGNNVYFRWRFHELSNSNLSYFWIDNIKVSQTVSGAEIDLAMDSYDYPEICVGGEAKFNVIVRNIGSEDLNINMGSSNGPFETDYVGTITAGGSDTVSVFFRPTTEGTFSNTFKFVSNAISGNDELSLTASSYLPLTNFFEGFDTSDELPEKWNKIKSPWDLYSDVSINSDYFSPQNCVKLLKLNDSISPIVLITPGVTNFDNNKLTFMAKKNWGATYAMTIKVGVISNPEDPSTFVAQETFELTDEYEKYMVTFKATNTVPYIAFMHTTEEPFTSLRIDDVSWEPVSTDPPNAAVIVSPDENETNIDIMMNPVLKWANGGGGPEGYKVSFGTNNPPSNIINAQDLTIDQMSLVISEELEYSTIYYWQVVPYNEHGDCENPPVWSFTTMSNPTVTTLPFTEDFNELVNNDGVKDVPLGWSYEDYHGDNVTWDVLMNNPSFPGMVLGNAGMHVPFHMMNKKDDYLYTPPVSLENGKTYKLSFMLHTLEDMVLGQIFNEEIEVKIGTDNKSESLFEEELVYANVNTEDWKEVSVNFTVNEEDDYYLAFHAISEAAYYLLIIDDIKLELVEGNAPVFESTAVENGKVDEIYTYNIEVTDADEDNITVSATEKPEWLTFTDNGDGTAVLTGTPKIAGDYNIKLTASDGSLNTLQEFSINIVPVGVNSESDKTLTIYPNPNNGQFYISVSNEKINGNLTIINVDGKIVHSTCVNSSLVINVQHLPSGFYQVLLPTTNGLIKQRFVIE